MLISSLFTANISVDFSVVQLKSGLNLGFASDEPVVTRNRLRELSLKIDVLLIPFFFDSIKSYVREP